MVKDFILASSSPQRRMLLAQIGYEPKAICSADIDEKEKFCERPSAYVKRIAKAKAQKVAETNKGENILSCDTIVVIGRRLLHKATTDEEQYQVMKLLSGKAHKVLSAVCVISKEGKIAERLVSTRILMKRLSEEEIKAYVASHEWQGCSGYKIEGCMEGYVRRIIGSYSGIVGLPLYETKNLLNGIGVK